MTLIKTKMLVKIGVEFNAPPGHPTRYKAISEAVFTANHLTKNSTGKKTSINTTGKGK